ncbi:MAG TPA: hypothetical protein DEP47_05495 [Chloroflexi bacterium]|nr:hypothetical protein [Chloroflexota bacterium]
MNLTTTKGFAPATMTEAMEFSKMLSQSSMVPKAYQGKPNDIMVCVQWGYEIGLAPMQALQNIAVINGKPSVYGDAAMALVQASSACEDVEEFFEGEGDNLIAVCIAKRKDRKPVTVKFSVNDAKRAGLWGKQGPWTQYTRRMMQMRARGFALRDAFPDVLKGLITAEEAQDFPTEKDVTPVIPIRNNLDVITVIDEKPAEEPVIKAADTTPNTDEEPPEEATSEARSSDDIPLYLPNKTEPSEFLPDPGAWLQRFEAVSNQVANHQKTEVRERMTKIRMLRDANEEPIGKLPKLIKTMFESRYKARLAALGAKLPKDAKPE